MEEVSNGKVRLRSDGYALLNNPCRERLIDKSPTIAFKLITDPEPADHLSQ